MTAVSVLAPIGASFPDLVMPVLDAGPDEPIFVRGISGIEPVTANVVTKEYNRVDGEYFVNSRLPKRNIVMTLGLNNVDVALPLIYGYMMTKQKVTLKFEMDGYPNKPVYIEGHIEAAPYDHFTQDPEVQVSVICPKPNFKSAVFTIEGTSGDDPDVIEFEYQGNQISGFELEMPMGGTGIDGDLIVEVGTGELDISPRQFKLDDAVISGTKTFYLNTKKSEKSVHAEVPGSTFISMLYKMNLFSFWLTLWPGTNSFRVNTPGDANPRDWTLTYVEEFGGI